jgi:hypothetical protein
LLAGWAIAPSQAWAQTVNEFPQLPLAPRSPPGAEARASQHPHLTGTALAFSVAGEVYQLDGNRLRLPGAVEGWEDGIELGVGVFRAIGQAGHYGAGVGLGDDEDVAVRAHMAMRW